MKKHTLTKTLSFVIFLMSLGNLMAKDFQNFNAKDGLNAANTFATKSLNSPSLIGICSINFSKNFYGTSYNFNFDVKTGSSNCWIYYFIDKNDNSKLLYIPVVKIANKFINFQKYCSDLGLENLAIAPKTINNFVDSDIFTKNFQLNGNLNDLQGKYIGSEVDFVAVFNNQIFNYGKVGKPVWAIFYSNQDNEESFACFGSGDDGKIFCEEITKKNNQKMLNISRANRNKVIVKADSKLNNINIVDRIGKSIDVNKEYNADKSIFEIDFSSIESGVYFIIVKDKLEKSIIKYIVE